MKSLLLLTIFGISLSVQEGYYHKQYQYKSSSSSYKNNELQHKTDDEEFSSVHGDLSGRDDPKVNAYTQHTEYRNPNSPEGQQDNFGGTQFHGSGGSSRYQNQNVGYASNADDVTGSISGKRKHISYSGTYTVSGGEANQLKGGNYDTQSNLLDLTQKVQNSLSSQLSQAVSEHHRSDGHQSTTGIENEFHSLEDELRANLTRKLQEELNSQYGSQTRRGSYSYSSSQTRPNYNTQELDDLTQQLQTNLLDQLRREYQTQSSSSSSQRAYSSSNSYGTTKNSYSQPSGTSYHYHPTHQTSSNDYTSRAHTTMYKQEAPTVQPSESLVDVTSKAQAELDMILNRVLMNLKTKYMNDDTYKSVYQPDYDIILTDLISELKHNITIEVNNALRNAYGLQEERNGYYFSTWNLNSNIANYKTDDLDNLKTQVEKNLLDKLRQEVRNQKMSYSEKKSEYQTRRHTETQTYNSWNVYPSNTPRSTNNNQHSSHSSQSQYSSSSSYATQYPSNRYPSTYSQSRDDQQQTENIGYHNTNRYPTNTYSQVNAANSHRDDQQQVEEIDYQYKPQNQRPSSYIPIDSGRYPSAGNAYSTSHSSNSGSSYQYSSGNQQSGLQTYQLPTGEVSRIQEELNQDLSQQVQRVLQLQKDQGDVYSSSQTNQATVDDLTEEFKRNFSRRVEEVLKDHGVRGGYSFTITSTGSLHNGQNNNRFAELTNQLQQDLLRQLREGLSKQSYHSQSSSSSSSSSSYQPIRYTSYGGGGINSASYTSGSHGGSTGSYGGHLGGYGAKTGGYGSSSANNERSASYQIQSGYRGVDYQQGECCMQSDEATSPKSIVPPRARADMPVDLEVEPGSNVSTEKSKALGKPTSTTPKTTHLQQSVFDQQTKDLQQQTQKLEQLTQDISKQLESLTPKANDKVTNAVPKWSYSGMRGQTSFDQQSEDLTQQTQKLEPLTQESLTQQQTQDFKFFDHQSSDLIQQTEDITHHNQMSSDLIQQTEDLSHFSQQLQHSDLTQQAEDLHSADLKQKTENSFQTSSGFSLHSQPAKKNDLIQQTEDFPQQQHEISLQTANVANLEEKEVNATVTEVEATTEHKGFWGKLGGKITSGYNTVKDKIHSIG